MADDGTTADLRVITEFKGSYAYLSNFWREGVRYRGAEFASAEHAFQASKCQDESERREVASAVTPAEARRRGRTAVLRPDWERTKKRVMLEIVLAKFTGDEHLRSALCNGTGRARLVEGNRWHDNYWGNCWCGAPACAAPGLNYLGLFLMWARAVLREDSIDD